MDHQQSTLPIYPFRRVVSEDDLTRLDVVQLVKMAGRIVAQLPDGWALVDAGATANDNPRSIDDA